MFSMDWQKGLYSSLVITFGSGYQNEKRKKD